MWGEVEEPIQWNGEEDEQKKTGWRLLETYFRESPIPGDEKPEAVEVSVEADLTRHGLPGLVGIIDLVRPGGRIVDFKTSGKTPDPEQAGHLNETQTTAYAVLYRQAAGKAESGIELHTSSKRRTPSWSSQSLGRPTEAQVTRLVPADGILRRRIATGGLHPFARPAMRQLRVLRGVPASGAETQKPPRGGERK